MRRDLETVDGEAGAARDDPEERAEQAAVGTSPVEWVVAGLGALLLAGLAGYLVRDGLSEGGPPDLRVEVAAVAKVATGWRVQVLVLNDGDTAASAVDVVATLKRDGETVEEATATVDYVPMQSEKPAGFFFGADPAGFDLTVRAVGYVDP